MGDSLLFSSVRDKPELLYFDCDIVVPSPTLAKADDGAVPGIGPVACAMPVAEMPELG